MDKSIIEIKNKIYDSFSENTDKKVHGLVCCIMLIAAFFAVTFSFLFTKNTLAPNVWIITLAILCVVIVISLIFICVLVKRITNLRYYALAVHDTYMKTMSTWPVLEGEKVMSKMKHNNHMAYEECKSIRRVIDQIQRRNDVNTDIIQRMSYILLRYLVCSDKESLMQMVHILDRDLSEIKLDSTTLRYLSRKSIRTVKDFMSQKKLNYIHRQKTIEAVMKLHPAYELYPYSPESFMHDLLKLYESVKYDATAQEKDVNDGK